jgi:2-hydroxychromene-2-carboxylate isomerase
MNAPRHLDFYFDFLSPFAYLAFPPALRIAERYGLTPRVWPIDLKAAKLAAGNTGPTNREIPAKLRYLTADMKRWAKRYGVPLVFPPNYASERANRGTFYAIDRGQANDYVQRLWSAAWGRGEDMSSPDVLGEVARGLGWPVEEFLDYTTSEASAQRYAQSNQQAHELGVFGVPMILIDDQMWWGNDRFDFIVEYLDATATTATATAR